MVIVKLINIFIFLNLILIFNIFAQINNKKLIDINSTYNSNFSDIKKKYSTNEKSDITRRVIKNSQNSINYTENVSFDINIHELNTNNSTINANDDKFINNHTSKDEYLYINDKGKSYSGMQKNELKTDRILKKLGELNNNMNLRNLYIYINKLRTIFKYFTFNIFNTKEYLNFVTKENCDEFIEKILNTQKTKRYIDKNNGSQLTKAQISAIKHELYHNPKFRSDFQEMRKEIIKLNITKEQIAALIRNSSVDWEKLDEILKKDDAEKENKHLDIKNKNKLKVHKKRQIENNNENFYSIKRVHNNSTYQSVGSKSSQIVQTIESKNINKQIILKNSKRNKEYLGNNVSDENSKNNSGQNFYHKNNNSNILYFGKNVSDEKKFLRKKSLLMNTSIDKNNNSSGRYILMVISILYFPFIYIIIGTILYYIIRSSVAKSSPRRITLTTDQ
uniref:Exported protein n=1 Tax=Strongyloides venezuelensis TaxID=75913 RepID=A0A0K0F9H5_STRVS